MLALFFLLLLMPSVAHATQYYVATTGSDAADGSSGTPFATVQKCTTVVAAGDTCNVADGTYTDTDANGIVVYVNTTNGTSGSPITIKSTNQYGAKLTVSSAQNGLNAGLYIAKDYYIIDGFEISGGANSGTSAAHHGIAIAAATGTVIQNNKIHDIARTVCSTSVLGNTGIYQDFTPVGTVIKNNLIYSVGRLRVGESACGSSVAGDQNDHGYYDHGSTNTQIYNNVIYDSNRGFPIQFYGGTVTNVKVYNNTISGHSSTGSPAGSIMLASTLTTADFQNNICYDPQTACFTTFSLTPTAITYDYFLTDSADADLFASSKPSNTTDGGHNAVSTSPGFTNAGSNDYTLASGSAARDTGATLASVTNDLLAVARPQNSLYDKGAYEYVVSAGGGSGGQSQSPAWDTPRRFHLWRR